MGGRRPLRLEHAAVRGYVRGGTAAVCEDEGAEERVAGVDVGVVGQRGACVSDMGVGVFRRGDYCVEGEEILGGYGYEGA